MRRKGGNESVSSASSKSTSGVINNDVLLATLLTFYEASGIDFGQFPVLNGSTCNLCDLYKTVNDYGGYSLATKWDAWDEIYSRLGLPPSTNKPGAQLRKLYDKHLRAFANHARKLGSSELCPSRSAPFRTRKWSTTSCSHCSGLSCVGRSDVVQEHARVSRAEDTHQAVNEIEVENVRKVKTESMLIEEGLADHSSDCMATPCKVAKRCSAVGSEDIPHVLEQRTSGKGDEHVKPEMSTPDVPAEIPKLKSRLVGDVPKAVVPKLEKPIDSCNSGARDTATPQNGTLSTVQQHCRNSYILNNSHLQYSRKLEGLSSCGKCLQWRPVQRFQSADGLKMDRELLYTEGAENPVWKSFCEQMKKADDTRRIPFGPMPIIRVSNPVLEMLEVGRFIMIRSVDPPLPFCQAYVLIKCYEERMAYIHVIVPSRRSEFWITMDRVIGLCVDKETERALKAIRSEKSKNALTRRKVEKLPPRPKTQASKGVN